MALRLSRHASMKLGLLGRIGRSGRLTMKAGGGRGRRVSPCQPDVAQGQRASRQTRKDAKALAQQRHRSGRPRRACGDIRRGAAARADRRTLPDGEPGACARDRLGAERDRGPAQGRARLQDVVRQGEPDLRLGRARAGARGGAADVRRNPRVDRRAGHHRRARERASAPGSPRRSTRCKSRPSSAARPTFWSRRRAPAARSTSRRGSSSRPGT